MNERLKEVFAGKVVNKRLTFNTGMDEFPRYVLEYLIDNYCEEATFDEDFELVTCYVGASEGAGRGQELRERIEAAGWAVEVEIIPGGQRSDHLLVAVE